MKGFTLVLFLVVVCMHGVQSRPKTVKQSDSNYIYDIMKKVPEQERLTFLKYHLQLGYDLKSKATEWPDNVTSEFAVKLLKYAMASNQIVEPESLKAARRVICFTDGTCIDLGDIGVHP